MVRVLRGTVKRGPVPVVLGVLFRDGRVLLGERKSRKKGWDGKWELPGGFIEHGETPEEALIREFREETGFDVLPVRLVGSFTSVVHEGGEKLHVLLLAYACELVSGSLRKSRAHRGLDWFDPDLLPESCLKGTSELIEDALRQPQSVTSASYEGDVFSEPLSDDGFSEDEDGEGAAAGFAGIFG